MVAKPPIFRGLFIVSYLYTFNSLVHITLYKLYIRILYTEGLCFYVVDG